MAVQEYEPAFHRLRLSASPKVPTNPRRIGLAGEPLGYRRGGISPPLTLLMPAFSLVYAPMVFTVHLQCRTQRSPTTSGYPEVHVFGVMLSPIHFRRRDA